MGLEPLADGEYPAETNRHERVEYALGRLPHATSILCRLTLMERRNITAARQVAVAHLSSGAAVVNS